MAKNKRGKKAKPDSFDFSKFSKKLKEESKVEDGNFKVSFQHLCMEQEHASSFESWEDSKKLASAMTTLKHMCSSTLESQLNTSTFQEYGSFPVDGYTMFYHPRHVPQDVSWARIHVSGKQVLAGHIHKETFYLVFLDEEHMFYLTKEFRDANPGIETPKPSEKN